MFKGKLQSCNMKQIVDIDHSQWMGLKAENLADILNVQICRTCHVHLRLFGKKMRLFCEAIDKRQDAAVPHNGLRETKGQVTSRGSVPAHARPVEVTASRRCVQSLP